MTEKCIYLDFDGVLHPNSVGKNKLFIHMPMLADVLALRAPRIVISSSWRWHESIDYIKALFPPALQSKVVGCTGPACPGPWARWHEIHQHAASHGIEHWIALDDAHSEFPPGCDRLILCDGTTGLQEAQLMQLQQWLQP